MTIHIERAAPSDLSSIVALLEQNHLPLDGLSDHIGAAIIARQDGAIIGCAALELYGSAALLRSVAVRPDVQQQGLGKRLTDSILDLARSCGVNEIYLLTTTAQDYFPRYGFERIDRVVVPVSVQQSVEFQSACPASAIAMRLIMA